ncbi:MAG: hypothetical protein KGJ59_06965 [Bacteroidota bacterium]|nr:hypothetical protein [Bacteroidota bacterium]
MEAFEKIKTFLAEKEIPVTLLHHEPTYTSEASARARGESVAIGGKAIVMKVDNEFKLFVLSAALKIDSKKIKQHFHAKNTRFATSEELLLLTGLVPGSVPPFGMPILKLALYVDSSIERNEKIAFNAGSLTDSIIMTTEDYLRAAQPEIFGFGKS